MTRLNLIDASLLDASGELGPDARQRLHARLARKPAARAKYNAIHAQFSRLSALPRPSLSDAEKLRIAGNIKASIHDRLAKQARETQALRRAKLIHYALAGLSAAAAAIVVVAGVSMMNSAAASRKAADSVAHLNRVIDRLAAYDSREASYDQALADVESSIRQLQAENGSMAGTQTNEMTPLLDALASLPTAPAGDPVDQLELPQGGF
jgi:anti-sigma factor RsiW